MCIILSVESSARFDSEERVVGPWWDTGIHLKLCLKWKCPREEGTKVDCRLISTHVRSGYEGIDNST